VGNRNTCRAVITLLFCAVSLCSLPASCGAAAGQLGWFATSTGNQISSRLLSARSANALLELPRAEGVIEAGSTVSALLIDDLGFMPQGESDVPATEGFFA
jgi:gephyrin